MSKSDVTTGILVCVVIAVAGLIFAGLNSIRIIQPGYVGVSVFLGNAREKELTEGMNFVFPFLTSVHKMDTRIQKIESSSFEAASKDLQSVRASIVVNYNLKQDTVVKLYREIGINYAEIVILPGVSEIYKATTAGFTAEELITKRQAVSEQIRTTLAARLETYGIIVNQVNDTSTAPKIRSIFETALREAGVEAHLFYKNNAEKVANDLDSVVQDQTIIAPAEIGHYLSDPLDIMFHVDTENEVRDVEVTVVVGGRCSNLLARFQAEQKCIRQWQPVADGCPETLADIKCDRCGKPAEFDGNGGHCPEWQQSLPYLRR